MNLLRLQKLKERLEAFSVEGMLRGSLFPQQRNFINDTSSRKAALCTRRAGKSHVAAIALIIAAMKKPNTVALYLALTRRSAKAIMWFKLKEIDRIYKIGLTFSESELIVTLPNTSRIVLFGADLENLADRLRGDAYCRVVVDEAQSFGAHLEMLISDVIEPALLDHQGDIILIGTPGLVPTGVFYDATNTNTAWSRHHWSLLDNPHLPHAANWLVQLRTSRGWSDDNPTWQREYLGRWTTDASALVYRGFSKSRNLFSGDLPSSAWTFIVGLDLGWHDKTAFCVLAYSKYISNAYVVRAFGRSQMTISRIADTLLELQQQYNPQAIIADTGGLGKSIAEELKSRYSLPVLAAEKTDKLAFIETVNGDFIDGKVFIHESAHELIQELATLGWDEKRLHENSAQDNHAADSLLYALRFSRHYWAKPKPVKLEGEALAKQYERDMMQTVIQAQEDFIKERENDDTTGIGSVFGGTQSAWSPGGEDW